MNIYSRSMLFAMSRSYLCRSGTDSVSAAFWFAHRKHMFEFEQLTHSTQFWFSPKIKNVYFSISAFVFVVQNIVFFSIVSLLLYWMMKRKLAAQANGATNSKRKSRIEKNSHIRNFSYISNIYELCGCVVAVCRCWCLFSCFFAARIHINLPYTSSTNAGMVG